jgi:hypothetical protein
MREGFLQEELIIFFTIRAYKHNSSPFRKKRFLITMQFRVKFGRKNKPMQHAKS